ncbi:zinc-binding metallopeptidase family protein [Spartinivicinus ruber]|uniref:zinc-binding metallopeptidase family protein n=1 Tax=Spartinivicinus ruber TaxID=2683272 RepID=UPI0013D7484B|nr:putative zinc-binding peptidase [Spartinivicinus ruber]
MKLFTCNCCGNFLYFENVTCLGCGASLGFLPNATTLVALEDIGNGLWQPVAGEGHYRMCVHYTDQAVCNWMVDADDEEGFCIACRLNQTIPDLSIEINKTLWQRLETEKRRLIYGLLQLGLPVLPRSDYPEGIAFEFLADTPTFSERDRVMTGHNQGLITLNIAEADPIERERMRDQMDEPYRTILGHFRHESGHYYWDRLIRDTKWLKAFRQLFGDDSLDYSAALEQHYTCGPPVGWADNYVSAYASSHAWEDWAETWAHYLHIVDTLETAHHFGVRVNPRVSKGDSWQMDATFDAYNQLEFKAIIDHWLPLTCALNSLNRSMGHGHVYPFVLAPKVVEKLAFVHRIVRHISEPYPG